MVSVALRVILVYSSPGRLGIDFLKPQPLVAGIGEVDHDFLDDAARSLAEHHDPVREINRLRDRMRDDQLQARRERLARRLATARRWQRLARYADQRSSHATERL